MRKLLLPLLLLAFAAAACIPSAPPAPGYTHADGWAAVDQAFADHGPFVVAQAHRVAACESNHWPYARNGQYRGVFQLGNNYNGTISVTHDGDVFNPYTNAWAARAAYDASGWRPWACRP